ncbi:MAG: C69 family dipeptidase [Candidatus Aminicenantes bacterium]|nr:C69 family dipeptidase [Candidatus Aminicenantes bacterium]
MKQKIKTIIVCIVLSLFFSGSAAFACTNFLISKGASTDGSTMITYAVDSHQLYGEMYHWPARDYAPGTMLEVYDWDTGKFLGKIKQAPHTYSVVAHMNEHQVSIGETTYGGRSELHNPKGIVDYGSAMFIALQRAKTAREAIKVIAALYDEYGYFSSGESFSISDPKEVWIMEMIGKGPGKKGAAWVARRVPDGYICAHANQARIRRFPLNDPQNCLYAKDVISFAREMGYFKGKDKDFSFADAYAPLDYGALRFCEARVWSMFRRAAPSRKFSMDYVKGVAGADPLPLWIKPDKKLSVHDVMEFMRDHFEDSEFDLSKGIGAGPFNLPYRWRGLTWKIDGVRYCNDRSTSTQQTAYSFVSQSRSWLPDMVGGIHWFGVDDTNSTCYIPIYSSINKIPKAFAVGTASFEKFSWESGFWVFNFVSNYAYSRYSMMIKDIKKVQRELESSFIGEVPTIDRQALSLYKKDPELARNFLTEYSLSRSAETVKRWMKLGEFLIFKYLDGNKKDENGKVTFPGYPESWYRRIVKEDGELYKMRPLKSEIERNYKEDVTRADELFKKKEFAKAKKAYESALKEKADEVYPKTKIAEIDKLLAEIDKLLKKIEFDKK